MKYLLYLLYLILGILIFLLFHNKNKFTVGIPYHIRQYINGISTDLVPSPAEHTKEELEIFRETTYPDHPNTNITYRVEYIPNTTPETEITVRSSNTFKVVNMDKLEVTEPPDRPDYIYSTKHRYSRSKEWVLFGSRVTDRTSIINGIEYIRITIYDGIGLIQTTDTIDYWTRNYFYSKIDFGHKVIPDLTEPLLTSGIRVDIPKNTKIWIRKSDLNNGNFVDITDQTQTIYIPFFDVITLYDINSPIRSQELNSKIECVYTEDKLNSMFINKINVCQSILILANRQLMWVNGKLKKKWCYNNKEYFEKLSDFWRQYQLDTETNYDEILKNILSTIKLEEFIQYPDTFDYAFLVFPYKISLSLLNCPDSHVSNTNIMYLMGNRVFGMTELTDIKRKYTFHIATLCTDYSIFAHARIPSITTLLDLDWSVDWEYNLNLLFTQTNINTIHDDASLSDNHKKIIIDLLIEHNKNINLFRNSVFRLVFIKRLIGEFDLDFEIFYELLNDTPNSPITIGNFDYDIAPNIWALGLDGLETDIRTDQLLNLNYVHMNYIFERYTSNGLFNHTFNQIFDWVHNDYTFGNINYGLLINNLLQIRIEDIQRICCNIHDEYDECINLDVFIEKIKTLFKGKIYNMIFWFLYTYINDDTNAEYIDYNIIIDRITGNITIEDTDGNKLDINTIILEMISNGHLPSQLLQLANELFETTFDLTINFNCDDNQLFPVVNQPILNPVLVLHNPFNTEELEAADVNFEPTPAPAPPTITNTTTTAAVCSNTCSAKIGM